MYVHKIFPCQEWRPDPYAVSVKNEDLSREIHEVTARPIAHGPAPLVFDKKQFKH